MTPIASDQTAPRSAGGESAGVPSPGCSGDGALSEAGLAERSGDVAPGDAPPSNRGRGTTVRRALIAAAAVALFLTVGLPRWLQHDAGSGPNDPARTFANVCRAHGGTLVSAPTAGRQGRCTVRYGGTVYLMDAVTTTGFDEDTAGFQKQGCQQARSDASPGQHTVFVYHPTTGVCEHRP